MAINRLVILDAGSVVLLVYFLCQMEGRSEKNTTTLVPTDLLVILSTLKKSVVCYKMSSSLFLKTAPSVLYLLDYTLEIDGKI